MSTAPLAVAAGLSAAVLSSVLTFLATRHFHRRRDQLELVNRQLAELYGPLISLRKAVHIAWREFRIRYVGSVEPEMSAREVVQCLDDHRVWYQWVTLAFMPGNRRACQTILDHGDLFIEGDGIPECVALFMLYVSGWEIGLARYDETGDKYELTSTISYPREFDEYLDRSYKLLKARQRKLLGGMKILSS